MSPPLSARRSPRRRRDRSSVGGAWNTCWQARLSCRRLPNPLAHAMSVTERSVSSRSRRAKCVRWLRASWSGVVPTCSTKSRRRWRTETPSAAPRSGLRTPVEGPLGDQVHRPAHQLRAGDGVGGLPMGAAPEARPIARRLRLGGRAVGHDVPGQRARRARWHAVDAGGGDALNAHPVMVAIITRTCRSDPDRSGGSDPAAEEAEELRLVVGPRRRLHLRPERPGPAHLLVHGLEHLLQPMHLVDREGSRPGPWRVRGPIGG